MAFGAVLIGSSAGAPAQQSTGPDRPDHDFRIAVDDERFGPGLPRPARVVDGHGGATLDSRFGCRWIPAHSDVGLRLLAPNGCAVEVYVDPRRTRRSRFELDPFMALDVIVRQGNARVGFAATRLRFVE